MLRIPQFLPLFLLVALAGVAPARAQDDTIKITVKAWIEAVRVSPQPLTGTAYHEFSITMSGRNNVSERYQGGGRYAITTNNSTTLGGDEAAKTSYRVVDANTIQRTYRGRNYRSAYTIRISGKSCSVSYSAQPAQAGQLMQSWSQQLGVYASYSRFTLARSTCDIQ